MTSLRLILALVPALLGGENVEFQASRVNMILDKGIVVEIAFLRGSLEPLEAGKPVPFD